MTRRRRGPAAVYRWRCCLCGGRFWAHTIAERDADMIEHPRTVHPAKWFGLDRAVTS